MKIIIAGSRTITDTKYLVEAMEEANFLITEIISGGARGVDKMGELFAEVMAIPLKLFPANWEKYGRNAGPIRNKQMMEYADALIAIWDEKSRGTLDMINQMRAANKKVYVKIVKGK